MGRGLRLFVWGLRSFGQHSGLRKGPQVEEPSTSYLPQKIFAPTVWTLEPTEVYRREESSTMWSTSVHVGFLTSGYTRTCFWGVFARSVTAFAGSLA